MNLDMTSWKEFSVRELFEIVNGRGITIEEIESNPGDLEAVQSGEGNNGVIGFISKAYCKNNGYAYCEQPCLTVARSGTAGYVSFHENGCVVGDSAKILLLKEKEAKKTQVYLFLQTLLAANRFKYTYGRKVTKTLYGKTIIKLPVKKDGKPDWKWIEQYVRSLHSAPLTTSNHEGETSFDVSGWKPFLLNKLFDAFMGNGIDAVKTSSYHPAYNYVSRDSGGNGIVARIDKFPGAKPFRAGDMTLSLGGSYLGSCFVQTEPFYTAQNVAILRSKENISTETKLFIATLIRREAATKFQAFGRELNTHYKKDFTIKLPVKKTEDGHPIIDAEHRFSDDGYIPDWEYMDSYVRQLPYGDRIPDSM